VGIIDDKFLKWDMQKEIIEFVNIVKIHHNFYRTMSRIIV